MISAVVHTYNEEDNIDRCLSSLDFVDDIVLVDMKSTDNTVRIARNFKARIFSHPYLGFVEPARNFAIEKAKNGWILIVDADEEIPNSLAGQITELIENPGDYNYFYIPRKNIIFGKWIRNSGWWPDFQIRLFKKGTVVWGDKIHAIPHTRGHGREIEETESNSIIHYHYQSVEEFLERLNRYTTIQAKDLYLNNVKLSLDMLVKKPVNEFIKRFFLELGYRDGFHGLALSGLQSFSELVLYLKLWQLSGFPQKQIEMDVYSKIKKEADRIHDYWLYNALLEKPRRGLERLFYRIRRKLNS